MPINGRITRHEGYKVSQRQLVEEAFGWVKTFAGMAKGGVRGLARGRFKFTFAMAGYNLIWMPRLLATARGERDRLSRRCHQNMKMGSFQASAEEALLSATQVQYPAHAAQLSYSYICNQLNTHSIQVHA